MGWPGADLDGYSWLTRCTVSVFSIPKSLESTTPGTFVVLVRRVAGASVPTLDGRVDMIDVIQCPEQTGSQSMLDRDNHMQGTPWNNKPCAPFFLLLCDGYYSYMLAC